MVLTSCGHSQSMPTSDSRTDVENMLGEGEVTADILGIKQFPEQEELSLRIQQSIEENYDWFVGFMQNVPNGQPMPYHPNLGVTEEEYNYLGSMMADPELVPLSQERLAVIKSGGKFTFSANGDLKSLEVLTIDLDKNVVSFNGVEMAYEKSLNITDASKALKSKWKGYRWSYVNPVNPTAEMIADRENLNASNYAFTIGKLEKNGKTYMRVQAMDIVNGVKTVQYELSLTY